MHLSPRASRSASLVDADVRFDAADKHLPRLVAFEFGDKLRRAAGTKRGLLNRLNRIGQDGANLRGGASQALRILFGDDNGDAEQLRGVRHEGDARGGFGEVGDGLRNASCFDDAERSLPRRGF